jgi:hypothetical protein
MRLPFVWQDECTKETREMVTRTVSETYVVKNVFMKDQQLSGSNFCHKYCIGLGRDTPDYFLHFPL